MQGAFLLVLGVGGARVAAGAISVGDLVAFVLFVFFLVMPLGQALNAYTQLQTGLGALERIHEVLDLPVETAGGAATAIPAPRLPVVGRSPAVEFEPVDFGYADSPAPVLREVSFDGAVRHPHRAGRAVGRRQVHGARPGRAVLRRDRRRGAGRRRRRARAAPHALRAQLGYVEQEAPVLAGTLRENLLLTVPTATEAEMLAVLAAVNLLRPGRAHPERAGRAGRRGRRAALRRRAATAGDRPYAAGRAADPAAGRADQQPRRPQRGGAARRRSTRSRPTVRC